MATAKQIELPDDQLQLIAKALSDPRRYEILKQIGNSEGREQSCAAMRDCIDVCAATLSHHMKELETAGLIRSEKDGKFVHYKLQAPVLRSYLDRLKSDLF